MAGFRELFGKIELQLFTQFFTLVKLLTFQFVIIKFTISQLQLWQLKHHTPKFRHKH